MKGLQALLNQQVQTLDSINDRIEDSPIIDTSWRSNMREASVVENRIERILKLMEAA